MNRSTRSLLPHLRPLFSHARTKTTIPTLLSALSSTKPLKDALKYPQPPPKEPTIFTYRDLHSHTLALASGLSELSYSPSDRILSLINPTTPEYAILLLAAAHLNLTLISLPLPADPANTSVQTIADTLDKHRPRALFIGKEFLPDSPHHDHDGIIASVHPLINALTPRVALDDTRGLLGFVPLTGRPFQSAQYPFLQHVIHTGEDNFRGTIAFKSLLVYSGNLAQTDQAPKTPLWVSAESGDRMSEEEILQKALDIANKMQFSSDHTAKNGKVVVKPRVSADAVSAVLAAVMKETLYVSPAEAEPSDVADFENALVF